MKKCGRVFRPMTGPPRARTPRGTIYTEYNGTAQQDNPASLGSRTKRFRPHPSREQKCDPGTRMVASSKTRQTDRLRGTSNLALQELRYHQKQIKGNSVHTVYAPELDFSRLFWQMEVPFLTKCIL